MAGEELTERVLVATATEATGLDDFGDDAWREGLDRLLHSLHTEADLSAIGVMVAQASLTTQLTSRLRVLDWHRRHPEIGAAPIPAPVVILGQPRTGTTILFDLLAQDPQFRVPLSWEVDGSQEPERLRILLSREGPGDSEALRRPDPAKQQWFDLRLDR